MRKVLSSLLAAVMIFALAIPCFAIKAAKFSVKKISETDSEVVVSVDYEGGSSFSCFDIEMTYNEKKLKVTEAYDGDGLDAFIRDAKKNQGAMVASVINKDSNPIKDSMAVTASFRVINGKDLLIAKFKKLSKDKITSDDIKVEFTNCATDSEKIQASVTNLLGGGTAASKAPVTTSKAAQPSKKTESSTSAADKTENKSDTTASDKTDGSGNTASSESESNAASNEVSESTEKAEILTERSELTEASESEKPSNTKKIIVISAAVICALFIIAAVCIFISKKNKKDNK